MCIEVIECATSVSFFETQCIFMKYVITACLNNVSQTEHLYWHVFSRHVEPTLQCLFDGINSLVFIARHLNIYNSSPYNSTLYILVYLTLVFIDNQTPFCYTDSANTTTFKQVVKVIWQKGHITAAHGRFNRIHQLAPMCTPSNTCFLGATSAHIPNDISIGSAIFAQLTAQSPYTLQSAIPLSPQNCSFAWGSGPHLIHRS